MDKIVKEFSFQIKDVDETDHSFWAIASTDEIDRDADTIQPDAWDLKNFKKNPVIPLFHNYHEFPVAKADKIKVEDKKLMFKPQFAVEIHESAKVAYQLYTGGYMSAFSVGFIPKEWTDETRKDGRSGRNYTKVELLEISAVVVPANANALTEARGKGIEVDKLDIDTVHKPEETDDFIHIPIKNADLFVQDSFRTWEIGKDKGIEAVGGKLKSDPDGAMEIQKYIFDKAKGWTMESAKKWVADHKNLEFAILKEEMAEEFAKVILRVKALEDKNEVLSKSLEAVLNPKQPEKGLFSEEIKKLKQFTIK